MDNAWIGVFVAVAQTASKLRTSEDLAAKVLDEGMRREFGFGLGHPIGKFMTRIDRAWFEAFLMGLESDNTGLRGIIPGSKPQRTGLPGRPSSWHLIEGEYRRRREAGECAASVSEEAKILSEWLEVTHPTMPRTTPKTIRNNLSSLFRQPA